MVIKSQTGMQGVYLVAAELTYLGFVVSPTSRSAFGADLLVTDQLCQKAWSVQVKTNRQAANFWLLSKHCKNVKSDSHVYVFVNLKGNQRPEFYVVPSAFVAEHIYEEQTRSGIWYSFDRRYPKIDPEAWEVFGDPSAPLEPEATDDEDEPKWGPPRELV